MNKQSFDLMVLGSGPGGYTAAFRAADLGLKVVLIEKHRVLGGVCLNVGCIPSKTLLHIAAIANASKSMHRFGLSDTFTPNLESIRQHKDQVIDKLNSGLALLAKKRQVTVIHGQAKFINQHSVIVNNEDEIYFKQAIIATGSRPIQLDYPQDARIIDSTGALMLQDIPQRLLIVGGGIIGLEMAEIYSSLGSKITIAELGGALIQAADSDIVDVLYQQVRNKYDIRLNTKCSDIMFSKKGVQINLNQEQQIFDKILVAVGRQPNTDMIDIQNTGVELNHKGYILTDKQCRSNVSHIYAIGDTTPGPMLAHKATSQAKIAAEACAGMKAYYDTNLIPSVAYTDPEISWVGLTEAEARQQNIAIQVGKFPWAASGRAISSDAANGITKIIADAKTQRVLGGAIVGSHASELIAPICLAIEMHANIHDIALTIHAHPTLSETIPSACEMITGTITDLIATRRDG